MKNYKTKDGVSFFIPCNPPKSTAQASLRIMKRKDGAQFVGKSSTSKGAQTQSELLALLSQYYNPSKRFVSGRALSLEITWDYAWRTSEPKKNKTSGSKWCDKRPDIDNICKLLLDCMTRIGFWDDDSQVANLSFSKKWTDDPGIGIAIDALPINHSKSVEAENE